jgi:alkanesulfonate monooxygenase SsuD/methylene tetrahydromethanopterin reductase-like flavin-dependent oxidoreductase (luciferase family)
VDIGLALPQYDYSVPGESPVRWATVVEWATRAEDAGFASVWLSDHLFVDPSRWGGPQGTYDCFDPIVGLGALARATSRVQLGTLVLCAPLRSPRVLAKHLETVHRLAGGRLIAGIGAGWNEAEFVAAGVAFERAGVRVRQLDEAVATLKEHQPAPVWVGGRGDRVMEVAARRADGFNMGGWTAETRRPLADFDRTCERVGRDPATVTRSVNHTVGDVSRLPDELAAFAADGVAAVVLGLGPLPFSVTTFDALDQVASALP